MSNDNEDWGQGGDWSDQPGGAPQMMGQPGEPQAPQQPQPAAPQQPQPAAPQQTPPASSPLVHQPKTKIKHKLEGNDLVVLALSFFIPGVGHMMLGQTMKGAVILAAVIFTCGAGYMAVLAVVADAYFCLMTKKDRQLDDWEFFPDYQNYI